MLNIDFLISRRAITLSEPHKVKGFRFGSPLYFISNTMCHRYVCLPVPLQRKNDCSNIYGVKNWTGLAAAGEKKEKENGNSEEEEKKHYSVSLAILSKGGRCFLLLRCQDVCHPGFIYLLCVFFFFWCRSRTRTLPLSYTSRFVSQSAGGRAECRSTPGSCGYLF